MQIYLIVGNKIRQAEATIVGKVAEVRTDFGVLEFQTWYESEQAARNHLKQRYIRKVAARE